MRSLKLLDLSESRNDWFRVSDALPTNNDAVKDVKNVKNDDAAASAAAAAARAEKILKKKAREQVRDIVL